MTYVAGIAAFRVIDLRRRGRFTLSAAAPVVFALFAATDARAERGAAAMAVFFAETLEVTLAVTPVCERGTRVVSGGQPWQIWFDGGRYRFSISRDQATVHESAPAPCVWRWLLLRTVRDSASWMTDDSTAASGTAGDGSIGRATPARHAPTGKE